MQPLKPYREERPWGEFVEYTRNTPSTVKIIIVHPGEALSLQHHHNRDEFWHVLSGEGVLHIGETEVPARAGENHFITRETKHRITAGTTELTILEISFGEFDDNDIVRFDDRYGRNNTSN